MHRLMNHLDELAGLDIVLARPAGPQAPMVQSAGLRRHLQLLLVRLKQIALGRAPDGIAGV